MANLTWTPPLFSALNLTSNCSLFGPFVADISRTGFYSAPIDATTAFMRSTLPNGFSPDPKDSQVLEWYDSLVTSYLNDPTEKNSIFRIAFVAAQTTCRDEFCGSIEIEGNPDIAGAGVMIAYAIEATLVSLYCLFMAVYQLRRHRVANPLRPKSLNPDLAPSSPRKRPSNRFFDAFRGSITNFWNSAAIVSLAITVVSMALTRNTTASAGELEAAWSSGAPVNLYDDELATIASTYSFFPVLLLSLLGKNRHRRRWLKRLVLLGLYILVLIQLKWNSGGVADAGSLGSSSGPTMVLACDTAHVDRIFRKFADPMFYLLLTIPVALTITTALMAAVFMWRRGGVPLPRAPAPESRTIAPYLPAWFRMGLRAGVCFSCFVVMWATLGWLLFVRRAIIAAGGGTGIREWGFGQMLALATWLPVMIEWGYIVVFGLKKGLESHVPQEYAIVYQELHGDPYEDSRHVGLSDMQPQYPAQPQYAPNTSYESGYGNSYEGLAGHGQRHMGFARAGRDSFEQDE